MTCAIERVGTKSPARWTRPRDVAHERGLEAWLSLETLMGCGVGICNGCPVETRPEGRLGDWPNAKCCVEGPVFRTADILVSAGCPDKKTRSRV